MNRIAILIIISLIALTTMCQAQTTTPPSDQDRPPRGQQGPPSVEEIFKMDSNKDGKLSKSEIKGPLRKDFAKVDTNKDGFISKKELKDAPKPERGARPPRP